VRNSTVRFSAAGYAGEVVGIKSGVNGEDMSERNGDRARFQKNRRRKLLHRQRIHAFVARLRIRAEPSGTNGTSVTRTLKDVQASMAMQDEGGPIRAGD
jgi:hypothetical protein